MQTRHQKAIYDNLPRFLATAVTVMAEVRSLAPLIVQSCVLAWTRMRHPKATLPNFHMQFSSA